MSQQQQSTSGIFSLQNCPSDVINVLLQVLTHLNPIVEQYLNSTSSCSSSSISNNTTPELIADQSPTDQAFDLICKSVWLGGASDDQNFTSACGVIGGGFINEGGSSDLFLSGMDFVEVFYMTCDRCAVLNRFCKGAISSRLKTSTCPLCEQNMDKERREDLCSLKASSAQWHEFEKSGVLDLSERECVHGYGCEFCSFNLTAELSRPVCVAPQILTLQLDRFYFCFETLMNKKNNELFKFSLNQQLKLLMADNSLQAYELVAVVDHYGKETSTGAYGGYFLNPSNRRWYQISTRPGEVPKLVEDLSCINSPSNYVFFFQKVVEKVSSWQSMVLSSQSVSDISFTFSEESNI